MSKKVKMQLAGGLGNNLFQIACGKAYSLRFNRELVLLNNKIGITHGHLSTYTDNILSKLKITEKENEFYNICNEPRFEYDEISDFVDKNVFIRGYFQSEKYFIDYEKEILELFDYPENYKQEIREKYKDFLSKETCAIHVRRGDYLQLSEIHPPQNMAYYMMAMKKMPKECVFVIISDDIQWCKDNFPEDPEKFIFIENNVDHEVLCLMSMCTHNIIANSSFSWWGAWLNKNINKIVVSPKNWFGPKMMKNDTKDLYCKNWIII